MSEWIMAPIESLLESSFAGEWGTEPRGKATNTTVFRGADFNASGRLTESAGVPRSIPVEKLKRIALRPGDILLEKSGGSPDQPVGRVSFFQAAHGTAASSNFLQTLRPRKDVDAEFLFYLLQYEYYTGRVLPFQQQTTGIINFRLKDYLKELVKLPPDLREQRSIAEVLYALDEQINQTECLVQKAKLQAKGLAAELLSCNSIASSDVDDILLSEVVPSIKYGISSSLETTGEVPVLRMNNLSGGEISIADLKYARISVSPDLSLQMGDVLFNRTNSMEHVGRTAIWRGQLENATFASYLVRLNPDLTRLTPEYLVYLLEWDNHQRQMRKFATPGVQQVNINPTSLRRCRVRVPKSLALQREAVAVLDAAREYIAELRQEVSKLRLQKKGLMHDLLTGATRVR